MNDKKHPLPDSLESLFDIIQNSTNSSINVNNSINQFLEVKARAKGVPIHGSFELTPLCNLDCKMCYVHLTARQLGNRKLLSVDKWKKLINHAVESGMLYATLTGGECLIYPEFDEIYLHLQSLGIRVSVITNAVLLNEERIHFFQHNPPALVQISVYGSDGISYENVTGHNVYDIVMHNIKAARDAGLRVRIGVTPNRYMGDDDKRIIRMLQQLEIPFAVNNYLFGARDETERHISDYDQSPEEFVRLKKLQLEDNNIPFRIDCPENPVSAASGLQCGGGNSGFFIDWQGTMYACSMLPDIYAQPLTIGFTQAWNAIHKAASKYPCPVECQSCKYSALCTKCAALHRIDAEPGHASKRLCRYIETLADSYLANPAKRR